MNLLSFYANYRNAEPWASSSKLWLLFGIPLHAWFHRENDWQYFPTQHVTIMCASHSFIRFVDTLHSHKLAGRAYDASNKLAHIDFYTSWIQYCFKNVADTIQSRTKADKQMLEDFRFSITTYYVARSLDNLSAANWIQYYKFIHISIIQGNAFVRSHNVADNFYLNWKSENEHSVIVWTQYCSVATAGNVKTNLCTLAKSLRKHTEQKENTQEKRNSEKNQMNKWTSS